MSNEREREAMLRARAFIDRLTVDAPDGDPKAIVEDENRFFAWDNEHRSPKTGKTFLFDWSYYIGIVMEGLYYMYEAGAGARYRDYAKRYLHAVETGGRLNRYAGYTPDHGVDCYKTASLLPFFMDEDAELKELADALFDDLARKNSRHTEDALGGNYWHVWRDEKPPRYRVWLDGLYMSQVFLARYARKMGDEETLRRVAARLRWVNENLINPENGLLYHAGNGKGDVCPFHWLRASGWYQMAQADALECLSGEDRRALSADFEKLSRALLRFRDPETGLWNNLIDQSAENGNRAESSGTAMMAYSLQKGARLGLLPAELGEAGRDAFVRLTEEKLKGDALTDVYLVAAASGEDNYRNEAYYMPQEGKGVGPYIMAYAEMLRRG